ncbi:putative b3 domain-containing protein [Quercus suber]|uniref:B3 domain-containing protein n=1 Tax=Quercus suber TaxID=58331 RepID=A0AAW0KTM0_QUESU
MGGKVEACVECTRKCLLIHKKKKNSSPVVTSFFKVMIGDQFSKVLFLPPKFAATISALVNQKTFLEDSSGRQWKVTISIVDGSLAFQRGWSSFSLDHGLEIGDFLVFNYMGSHFVVNIYNKTGCEKLLFPENSSPKKRARTNCNSTAKPSQWHTNDEDSMNKQGSSTSAVSMSGAEISQSQCTMEVPENPSNHEHIIQRPKPTSTAEYCEETYYMIDRDVGDRQDDRSSMLDLSKFEMKNINSVADVTKKSAAKDVRSSTSQMFLTETCLFDKDPVTSGTVSKVGNIDASEIERSHFFEKLEKKPSLPDKSFCNDNTSGHLFTTSAVMLDKNKERISDILNTKCQIAGESGDKVSKSLTLKNQVFMSSKEHALLNDIDSCRSAAQKFIAMSESFGVPNNFDRRNCQTGKESKVIKEELIQHADTIVRDNDIGLRMVKAEPVDSIGISSLNTASTSSLVATENNSFLELSTCLPYSSKGRVRMDRKVVYLRDSDMKLWPVLYHERPNLKLLASGWESFSEANKIQTGDECVFSLESEGIYVVQIIRK